MSIDTQVIKGGEKNYSVLIKGVVVQPIVKPLLVIDLGKIAPQIDNWKGIRLDSVLWLIEEKMGFRLWWDEECRNLVLPMESRNHVRFDEGIQSPRVADGWKKKIWMTVNNFEKDNPNGQPKYFTIIVDFDKQ